MIEYSNPSIWDTKIIGMIVIVGFFLLFILFHWLLRREEPKEYTCRMCGKKGSMAITYENYEGLCRKCFDEVLPYSLRDGEKKE